MPPPSRDIRTSFCFSLNNGADINAVDIRNDAALHQALNNRRHNLALLLIDRGADVVSAGRSGTTPLHWAAAMGFPDIIARLVQGGADLEVQDGAGQTPLAVAIERNEKPSADLLGAWERPDRTLPSRGTDGPGLASGSATNEVAALEGEHQHGERGCSDGVQRGDRIEYVDPSGPTPPRSGPRPVAVRKKFKGSTSSRLAGPSSPRRQRTMRGRSTTRPLRNASLTAWPTMISPARTKWPRVLRW